MRKGREGGRERKKKERDRCVTASLKSDCLVHQYQGYCSILQHRVLPVSKVTQYNDISICAEKNVKTL